MPAPSRDVLALWDDHSIAMTRIQPAVNWGLDLVMQNLQSVVDMANMFCWMSTVDFNTEADASVARIAAKHNAATTWGLWCTNVGNQLDVERSSWGQHILNGLNHYGYYTNLDDINYIYDEHAKAQGGTMHTDLQNQINILKGDIAQLRSEIALLKNDVITLKAQMPTDLERTTLGRVHRAFSLWLEDPDPLARWWTSKWQSGGEMEKKATESWLGLQWGFAKAVCDTAFGSYGFTGQELGIKFANDVIGHIRAPHVTSSSVQQDFAALGASIVQNSFKIAFGPAFDVVKVFLGLSDAGPVPPELLDEDERALHADLEAEMKMIGAGP